MPRPARAGRPGTSVIPADWAATQRPTVEATLDTPCSIRPPGGTPGAFDRDQGEYVGGSQHPAHFTGLCTVEDLPAAERAMLAADEQIPAVDYLVTLAVDAAPDTAVGHIVTITAAPPNGTPDLAGRQLTVESIERGSRAFTRALLCSENQT